MNTTCIKNYLGLSILILIAVSGIVIAGDVDKQNGDGRTALHVAAHCGNLKEVRNLLNRGAHVSIRDAFGDTPLHLSTYLQCSPDYNLISQMLIEACPDAVNIRNKYGKTPLHNAARSRNTDVVQLLLDAGADASIKDEDGKMPCDLVSIRGIMRHPVFAGVGSAADTTSVLLTHAAQAARFSFLRRAWMQAVVQAGLRRIALHGSAGVVVDK